jgi:hypothetical protein
MNASGAFGLPALVRSIPQSAHKSLTGEGQHRRGMGMLTAPAPDPNQQKRLIQNCVPGGFLLLLVVVTSLMVRPLEAEELVWTPNLRH